MFDFLLLFGAIHIAAAGFIVWVAWLFWDH